MIRFGAAISTLPSYDDLKRYSSLEAFVEKSKSQFKVPRLIFKIVNAATTAH